MYDDDEFESTPTILPVLDYNSPAAVASRKQRLAAQTAEKEAQEAADKAAGIVRFSTNSGGKPENHGALNWLESKETFAYNTTANGSAYRWSGAVKAVEIECDKAVSQTFNGDIVYRKFRREDGTEFYYGYGKGSPYNFDHAIIRMVK